MSTEKYPFPQYQLCAFVLDELKPEVAKEIQLAADRDPELAAEIAEIRAMIGQLTQLYKHEAAGIEPTAFILAAAVQPARQQPVTQQPAEHSVATSKNVSISDRGNTLSWSKAIGLLAMSASLLIAVLLAAPALKRSFDRPKDAIAHADDASRVAAAESRNRELTEMLEQSKTELASEQVAKRSSASKEQDAMATPSDEFSSSNETSIKSKKEAAFIDSLNDVDRAAAPPSAAGPMNESKSAKAYPEVNERLEKQAALARGGMGMGGMGMEGEMGDGMGMGMGSGGEGGMMGGMGMGSDGSDMGMGGAAATPSSGMGMGAMGMGGMGGMGSSGMGMGGMGSGAMGMDGGMGMEMGMDSGYADFSDAAMDGTPRLLLEDEEAPLTGAARAAASESRSKSESLRRRASPRYGYSPQNSDRYAPIYENPFKSVEGAPLSTFSIDVDTASYVKTRQFLLQSQSLPPANAVRIEEFINYFEYEYAEPQGDDPFAAHLAVATCPWRPDHKLVRIALQAKKIDVSERPQANIVFLLDVSGSMAEPNKLPLVKESMRMMIQQLGENDRVAMVVYAGAAGCVLESTTGDQQDLILGALERLNAGGSTNGGQGIQLAYDIARDHFIPGGVNRVILCTDGDFNVGTTSTRQLVNLVVQNAKSKVFLTVLGFGMGNTNDAMMEQISNKGNGIYNIVDSRREAKRQMVKQLAGNLMTIAKDVKIQVEFNPERVASYRLIGYENRVMANEDFDNDKKDAGEIGAGHRVTALYEIEPIGASKVQPTEGLRYQKAKRAAASEQADAPEDETSRELLAVKLRYKQPEGDTSKLLQFPLVDANQPFAAADPDFKWAASVAQFAMLLRNSTHKGTATWSDLLEMAEPISDSESRRECLKMIQTAAELQRSRVGY